MKEYLIDKNAPIIEAITKLNSLEFKTLYCVDKDELLGSITDGDIRRFILKTSGINGNVSEVMNKKPITLNISEKSLAQSCLKKYEIKSIPLVDNNNKIIEIINTNNMVEHSEVLKGIPVVIMAGGLGTRLYPYTKILPKPLIPIGEIPIMEHIINKFKMQGATNFYVVVNHKKGMIKSYFNELDKDYTIDYIDEDIPLGTGGGLSLLKGMINGTFILTNCDILIDENYGHIIENHRKKNNIVTMVCSTKKVKIPYGVVDVNEDGTINKLREKPEFDFFTNTGFYIVESNVIEELNDNESIGFPTVIEKYMEKKNNVGVFPISEDNWLDMGQIDELDKMRKRLGVDE